ncbi:hypothetical protein M2351_003955 [Azospirillum canadense]|nr:hypothetical protein [Azospirillum canadense]
MHRSGRPHMTVPFILPPCVTQALVPALRSASPPWTRPTVPGGWCRPSWLALHLLQPFRRLLSELLAGGKRQSSLRTHHLSPVPRVLRLAQYRLEIDRVNWLAPAGCAGATPGGLEQVVAHGRPASGRFEPSIISVYRRPRRKVRRWGQLPPGAAGPQLVVQGVQYRPDIGRAGPPGPLGCGDQTHEVGVIRLTQTVVRRPVRGARSISHGRHSRRRATRCSS